MTFSIYNYLFSFSLNVGLGMKWKCPRVVLLFGWVSIFSNYCHSCHLIIFLFLHIVQFSMEWLVVFFCDSRLMHTSISTWHSNFSVCNDIPLITRFPFISWKWKWYAIVIFGCICRGLIEGKYFPFYDWFGLSDMCQRDLA